MSSTAYNILRDGGNCIPVLKWFFQSHYTPIRPFLHYLARVFVLRLDQLTASHPQPLVYYTIMIHQSIFFHLSWGGGFGQRWDHSEQVTGSLQGSNIATNNHPHSHSQLQAIYRQFRVTN